MDIQEIIVGKVLKIDENIATIPDDGVITPKARRMGGCVGAVKEISTDYGAASLDIHGGEVWVPAALLSDVDNEPTLHYACFERFHNCSFMPEDEEKLLYDGEMTLETAKFIAANSTICDETSESVVKVVGGGVVSVKQPKGRWEDAPTGWMDMS